LLRFYQEKYYGWWLTINEWWLKIN
jgi:hypothetical protein